MDVMNEFIERPGFALSLHSPWLFRNIIRPELYRRETDPEDVHEAALEMADRYASVIAAHRECFDFPDLRITIKGKSFIPFGTAAGMDKNGDALVPFSNVFGFLEPGTVTFLDRRGNDKPRVAIDDKNRDFYNAQGFPSKGLMYFLDQVDRYKSHPLSNNVPLYVNICGVPPTNMDRDEALDRAWDETDAMILHLVNRVDGFVWNPFSPNTETLKMLRTPYAFERYAKLFKLNADKKLRLVKMGPYNAHQRGEWLSLVGAWLDGGGDGIVAVNTYATQRNEVPVESWGYPTAGRSGKFLSDYRLRAVNDTRREFPQSVIFATGGIFDADDAYNTFYKGADAVEGYTPFAYEGLGLSRKLMKGVSKLMRRDGYQTLEDLRQDVRGEAQDYFCLR